MKAIKYHLGDFKSGDQTESFFIYTFPELPNFQNRERASPNSPQPASPPLYYRVRDIVTVFLNKFPEYITHCLPVLKGFDPFYILESQTDELFIMVAALQSIAYKFPDQPHLTNFCAFRLEEFKRGQANNVMLSLGFSRIRRPVATEEGNIPIKVDERQRSVSATQPATRPREPQAAQMARGTTTPSVTGAGYPEPRSPHYPPHGPPPNNMSRDVNRSHEGVIHKPGYPPYNPAYGPGLRESADYAMRRSSMADRQDGGPPSKRQRSIPMSDGYPALPSPLHNAHHPNGPYSQPPPPPVGHPARPHSNPHPGNAMQIPPGSGPHPPPPNMTPSLSSPMHSRDPKLKNSLNLTVYTPNYDDPAPTTRPAEAPYSAPVHGPAPGQPQSHRPLVQTINKPYPRPPNDPNGYPPQSPGASMGHGPNMPVSSPLRSSHSMGGPPTGLPRSRLNSESQISRIASPPDAFRRPSDVTPGMALPAHMREHRDIRGFSANGGPEGHPNGPAAQGLPNGGPGPSPFHPSESPARLPPHSGPGPMGGPFPDQMSRTTSSSSSFMLPPINSGSSLGGFTRPRVGSLENNLSPRVHGPIDRQMSEALDVVRRKIEHLSTMETQLEYQLRQSSDILSALHRRVQDMDTNQPGAIGMPTGSSEFWNRMHQLVTQCIQGGEPFNSTPEGPPSSERAPVSSSSLAQASTAQSTTTLVDSANDNCDDLLSILADKAISEAPSSFMTTAPVPVPSVSPTHLDHITNGSVSASPLSTTLSPFPTSRTVAVVDEREILRSSADINAATALPLLSVNSSADNSASNSEANSVDEPPYSGSDASPANSLSTSSIHSSSSASVMQSS